MSLINAKNDYLIFDLDNTLIWRDEAMLICIEDCFKTPLNQTQKVSISKFDKGGHSDRLLFATQLKKLLNLSDTPKQIWQQIKTNIGRFVQTNSATKITLRQLKENYKIAIFSNGGFENQMNKIQQTGLDQLFSIDKIFISSAIGFDKPDIRSFQAVEKNLNHQANYIMIGDHWENDILGALNAGWKAIYLNNTKKIKRHPEVKSISALTELPELLSHHYDQHE